MPRALPRCTTVERVVTVALAIILFDGGMHIGRRRFRTAAACIVWTGIAGTLVTAAGTTVAARYVAGMGWHLSLLVGTAVAATDPAVVFSVFGRREIAGRTGVLLEGESGANDPVGIALLPSLLAAHGGAGSVAWHVATEFLLQMAVGVAVGVAGGLALLAFMRRVPLPSEGLYSPRVLAGVLVIFGAATRRPRVRVPRGPRGRHPHRRRARPLQAGDPALPLLARLPGRDRGLRHARPDHAPVPAEPAHPPGPTASPWRRCWRSSSARSSAG